MVNERVVSKSQEFSISEHLSIRWVGPQRWSNHSALLQPSWESQQNPIVLWLPQEHSSTTVIANLVTRVIYLLSIVSSTGGFNTVAQMLNHKFVYRIRAGYQSAHWAPSSNLVVALESGVYVSRINEDCSVTEIRNNVDDPENPFCLVIWNAEGSFAFFF